MTPIREHNARIYLYLLILFASTVNNNTLTLEETGAFHNYLSTGCKICYKGAKMVLFITGLCPQKCFYCPISENRKGDRVFANERPATTDEDIITEAEHMNALGTGITGGEPLSKPERTLHYIKLLKEHFGPQHHIHLYTSMPATFEILQQLKTAGLDEIRFHPPHRLWDNAEQTEYYQSIKNSKSLKIETGIEIPAITPLEQIARLAKKMNIFLNLNELEFSETNAEQLHKQKYTPVNDTSCAVLGSREKALDITHTGAKIHFCPSAFKDSTQLRQRLLRTAKNKARIFEEISEDGTIICGIIRGSPEKITRILKEAGVPGEYYKIKDTHVETCWQLLEELETELKNKECTLEVVERYPTYNGPTVETTPI